ncbi:protocatechuate 3,4-dioxygenase [Steroidobacter cummioxidans]|uniref:DODA-type extradiol aromatic ring-opening family dioxygenase n=1 Tax=Steroidobacter cummioxidans TaxID=1803913 RepID=UPI000E31273B|nr:protocatechuate 3,4-dioxygenase [Steroidobacter cummioxidans]
MARIVLGMAVPHSGMLGKAAESLLEDGERDRKNPQLWFRNRSWTFPELAAARTSEGLDKYLTLEERRARMARCGQALETLRRVYLEHQPDVAVILGKDQKEIFIDTSPSLAIYMGDTIHNGPPQRAVYAPDKPVTYPAHPELALHLIKSFQDAGFDMTEVLKWPDNVWMKPQGQVVPHAYGFIYHQIMRDDVVPNVPIIMNTFYPPNQPSMRRSIQFGKTLFEAIKAWDSDKKVALIASGGLSHFVWDEQLDQQFLQYFREYDFEGLAQIDNNSYQSGTSEVKLYVPVMVASSQLGFKMNLVDYVPVIRTEAGTGEGFGFMYWSDR